MRSLYPSLTHLRGQGVLLLQSSASQLWSCPPLHPRRTHLSRRGTLSEEEERTLRWQRRGGGSCLRRGARRARSRERVAAAAGTRSSAARRHARAAACGDGSLGRGRAGLAGRALWRRQGRGAWRHAAMRALRRCGEPASRPLLSKWRAWGRASIVLPASRVVRVPSSCLAHLRIHGAPTAISRLFLLGSHGVSSTPTCFKQERGADGGERERNGWMRDWRSAPPPWRLAAGRKAAPARGLRELGGNRVRMRSGWI